jgi:hypothetical protein
MTSLPGSLSFGVDAAAYGVCDIERLVWADQSGCHAS